MPQSPHMVLALSPTTAVSVSPPASTSAREVVPAPGPGDHGRAHRSTMSRMISSGVKASQLSRIAAARHDVEAIAAGRRKKELGDEHGAERTRLLNE